MPLDVIIVGYGFAGSTHWAPAIQKSKDLRLVGIVETDSDRRALAAQELTALDWMATSIEAISTDVSRDALVFVVTPDHFPVIKELVHMGFHNLCIEKPVVSRDDEWPLLLNLQAQYGLRMYLIDHYYAKIFSLLVALGLIDRQDPRLAMLKCELDHAVGCLGEITGVSYINLEAGEIGVKYLETHPWVEKDLELGGMIRDLGPHAFAPLAAAGLLSADAKLCDVSLGRLNPSRSGFERVITRDQIEMLVSVVFVENDVSMSIVFGKMPSAHGSRVLTVQGTYGTYCLNLPRGGAATVFTHNRSSSQLSLTVSTNEFVIQEIGLYFAGCLPGHDGYRNATSVTMDLQRRVRKTYFQQLLIK